MAGQEGRITAQRLREAMEARHLRQTDLCRATGIPKSAMCQYLKGDFSPKAPSGKGPVRKRGMAFRL